MAYQSAQAQKRHQREQAAASRQHAAAVREHERAVKAAERAEAQRLRQNAAADKASARAAKQAQLEARLAEVAALNAELAAEYEDIDSILAWTLDFDDHLDLEELHRVVEHPPFPRPDLLEPIPVPEPIVAPPEPIFVEPEPIRGLFSKKKNEQARAEAQAAHEAAVAAWQAKVAMIPARQFEQVQRHQAADQRRAAELSTLQAQYQAECAARDQEVAEHNAKLEDFIAKLGVNDQGAVQEYIGLVLARSVYPDSFSVGHDFDYAATDGELTISLTVPAPDQVPIIREHKYNKSKDEITTTSLTQKDQKERYASAICQVAVRTLHEVFEADRHGQIGTIAVTLSTDTIDAGTGLPVTTPLLAVAASRDEFVNFDLGNVVPAATLEHLNAVVSKNPFGLIAIATGPGVRG
jgi:restriction system protein